MEATMNTYIFTSDPGHGWLHVKRAELFAAGVADIISEYSYQHGDTVYLEEDCDATCFLDALKAKGIEYRFDERTVNSKPIRRYDRFKA